MAEWVTQREAAELLGVHVATVPKLIRRGLLRPRERRRPSLARADVLDLAAARAAAAEARETGERAATGPRPPDVNHEWLPVPAAAAVLGCTVGALGNRVNRGQVPCTVHDGRRWFRLDLLELQVRARVASERRQTSR